MDAEHVEAEHLEESEKPADETEHVEEAEVAKEEAPEITLPDCKHLNFGAASPDVPTKIHEYSKHYDIGVSRHCKIFTTATTGVCDVTLTSTGSPSDNAGSVDMIIKSESTGATARANADIDPAGSHAAHLTSVTGQVSVFLEYSADSDGLVSAPIYLTYSCTEPVVEPPVVEPPADGPGVIEGSVVTSDGGDAGAVVGVTRTSDVCGSSESSETVESSGSTDESNDYRIEGLAPGCYEVTLLSFDEGRYMLAGALTVDGLTVSADSVVVVDFELDVREPAVESSTEEFGAIIVRIFHDEDGDGQGDAPLERPLGIKIAPCSEADDMSSNVMTVFHEQRFNLLPMDSCWVLQVDPETLENSGFELLETDCVDESGLSIELEIDTSTPEQTCDILVSGGTLTEVPTGNSLPAPTSRSRTATIFGWASVLGSLLAAAYTALEFKAVRLS